MISTLIAYQDLIISAMLLIVALLAVYGALKTQSRFSGDGDIWKDKYADLERRLSKIDSVFGAYPGLIFIWDENLSKMVQGWGKPKVYGSPAALASMQRFAEPGRSKDMAPRILDGLADLDAISERDQIQTLRTYLEQLWRNGEGFSISIVLPEGNVIEADGRVAGSQVVLWLEDASIRGEDERTAISRFEAQKLLTQDDPVAFIDMLGRAPFPIWRMSSKGRLVWVNDAYINAVQANTISDVLDKQMLLDRLAAEEAEEVLATQNSLENIRKVTVGNELKSMRITLFPISGGAVGMADY